VDLSELNGPDDKLVIVVTQPLTTNENWVAMAPGELRVFKDGSLLC
jgi:glutamine amidotransferase